MTLAEINRAVNSKIRVMKIEEKKLAIHNYILADLIGFSVSRIHNKSNKMPVLEEAYSFLFDTEDIEERKEQQQIERFKAQLMQFTKTHNKKLGG